MQSFRESAERRPVAFAIVASLLALSLDVGAGHAAASVGFGGWITAKLAAKVVTAGAAVWLLRDFGWSRDAGIRAMAPGTWWMLWLPGALALLEVAGLMHANPWLLPIVVAIGFAIGLAEELWFRGVILRALRPLGDTRAALVSGLLFASLHLSWIGTRSIPSVCYTEWYTFALGVLWAALVLRTGSLWPGVVLHGLMDVSYYASGFQRGRFSEPHFSPVRTVVYGIFLAYGLYLIRTVPSPAGAPVVAPTS